MITATFPLLCDVGDIWILHRESEFKGQTTYAEVLCLAEGARGADTEGYRSEFINLVKSAAGGRKVK
ncbi:MAG: YfbK domain-containing protein [Bacteroidota bacterium]